MCLIALSSGMSDFVNVGPLEHASRPTTRGAPCDRGHLAWSPSRDLQSAKGWGILHGLDLLRSEPVIFFIVSDWVLMGTLGRQVETWVAT